MTDFTEVDLDTDIPEMEGDEAKETLSEFMKVHKENRQAYDERVTEAEETASEYQEELEDKEELISDFKEERAEKAAEYVSMPAELLADRFDFSELDQIIEEAEEAEEGEETEFDDETPDEEDDSLTTFSEQPEKGEWENDNRAKYRDRAKERLAQKGFPVQD